MSVEQFAKSGEMVTTSLRGYRSWTLRLNREGQCALGSVGIAGYLWNSKEITAECKRRDMWIASMDHDSLYMDHDAPVGVCTCGIYGWYEPENTNRHHGGSVMGVVEYSGRILMGSEGFRAEKAKIIAITVGSNVSRRSLVQISDTWSLLEKIKMLLTEDERLVGIDYENLLEQSQNFEKEINKKIDELFRNICSDLDIEYVETIDELVEKYPPQLDTVKNVIGEGFQKYNARY